MAKGLFPVSPSLAHGRSSTGGEHLPSLETRACPGRPRFGQKLKHTSHSAGEPADPSAAPFSSRLPAPVLSSPHIPGLASKHPVLPQLGAARGLSQIWLHRPLLSQFGGCVAGETLWASSLTGLLLCICLRSCFNIPLSFFLPPCH